MREALGETIRDLRTRNGLTQEEVARRLECNRQTVGRWEKGQHFPDDQTIRRLPSALGVSVEEFNRVFDAQFRLAFARSSPDGSTRGSKAGSAAYPPVPTGLSEIAGHSEDEWVQGITYFRRSDLFR